LALLFPLVTMVLTSLLSVGTLLAVRGTQLAERESEAKRTAYANAAEFLDRLVEVDGASAVQDRLDDLRRSTSSEISVYVAGRWDGTNPIFSQDDVPDRLFAVVKEQRRAALQRIRLGDQTVIVVGVPLRRIDGAFFQITSLDDLDQTLQSLVIALPGAVAVTTLMAFLLGRAMAGAALAPLSDVRRAAEKVAAQQLDTRLPVTTDAELEPIVTSFNNMVAALQDRIARDARFASDVSHELRSPLMTLSASVEVLQRRKDELSERAATAVDLLAEEIERFQALVADLLEISRFDAGAQKLELSELVVVEFMAGVARQAAGRSVPVRHLPGEEQIVITADRRRLVQVITNLIGNAAKYGDGVTALTLDVVDGGVEIGVEDSGPGVPADERELIFRRFARGGSAGRRGADQGTGLGLALTEEHVRLHGGRIWCTEARSGSGARFAFHLPTTIEFASEDDDDLDLDLDHGERVP
jgi:signal transduction histidine kinase